MSNEEIIKELKSKIEEMTKNTAYVNDCKKCELSDGSQAALIKKEGEIFIIPVNNSKPITYKNPNVNTEVGEPRTPNEKEQRNWIIDRLRYYYFSNKSEFSRSSYYSLKGMTRKGNIEPVLRYLESKWNIGIRKDFDSMCKSKTIFPIMAKITFPNPVKVCTIDIEVPKEVAN